MPDQHAFQLIDWAGNQRRVHAASALEAVFHRLLELYETANVHDRGHSVPKMLLPLSVAHVPATEYCPTCGDGRTDQRFRELYEEVPLPPVRRPAQSV